MEEIYHKYEKYNGIDTLVIYVNYPADYEFGLDFETTKKRIKSLAQKIREYAFSNLDKFNNQTVLLILNGVVVGSILLTTLTGKLQAKEIKNISKASIISQSEDTIVDSKSSNSLQVQTYDKAIEEKTSSTQVTTTYINNISKSENKSTNKNTGTTNNSQPSTNLNKSGKMISLILSSGNVISIDLEEYLVGVVASEMPASFNIEALKAQAVAARTYALKKTSTGAPLSATISDQVYKTNNQLKALWGNSYNIYYNKVANAINSTKGKYLTYNGKYIDALYFSISNGKTEDPKFVWGSSYPYLKSVESPDKNLKSTSYTTTLSLNSFNQKLGTSVTDNSQINIIDRTSGDRINNIKIGNKTFTGVKVRSLLGLRSADFSINISGGTVTITTKGYGHGCGMSQYGANEMAKQGKDYIYILNYYYSNVEIKSL
ncbi:sporulation stage II protein D firmicutes [Clostridium sp. CAG:1219]|nr:sporulation stage II protein D firmicutes [Clostridium sp. CAG:1219]